MRSHLQTPTNGLGNYLRVNRQFIPDVVSLSDNLSKIIAVSDYFPNLIVYIFGLECVLNNTDSKADFFFCIGSREKHNNFLERNNPLLHNNLWKNITLFYDTWQNEKTILAQKVADIWLEFDHEQYNNQIPIPSIFFDTTKINSLDPWEWIIDNSLTQLLGHDIPRSQRDLFLQAISQLPNNVAVFQVGLLLSRPQQNIRIYTTAITISQIRNYLAKLNWQRDIDLLVNILGRIYSLVDKYQLQIEIGDELSDTIAIEFYCYNQTNLQRLLEYLTTTGFCLPEKRDALLAFPDSSADLARRIAYLKMTYKPQNPLQFKAYLGVVKKRL